MTLETSSSRALRLIYFFRSSFPLHKEYRHCLTYHLLSKQKIPSQRFHLSYLYRLPKIRVFISYFTLNVQMIRT